METLRALQEMGVRAELTVCGDIPAEHVQSRDIIFKGLLDKNRSRELAELAGAFTRSTFLIVPSRAEAYGIVFCEASAFGLPSLSARTGRHSRRHRGRRQWPSFPPLEARAPNTRRRLQTCCESERNDDLVRSSRRLYDERLNWPVWGRRVRSEMSQLLGRSTATRSSGQPRAGLLPRSKKAAAGGT